MKTQHEDVHPGDVVVVPAPHVGDHSRSGRIVEILGAPDHTRYRVLWDDGHETIFSPDADTTITHVPQPAA